MFRKNKKEIFAYSLFSVSLISLYFHGESNKWAVTLMSVILTLGMSLATFVYLHKTKNEILKKSADSLLSAFT
ncbi:hypothetical protein, partial [Pectobacterium odoriferum]|uniref:hypothetical protein n=1 Tax=Pectobacterium odoriferum TaxID=78398 RepID=UPI001C6FABB8